MARAASENAMRAEQDARIAGVVDRERSRLHRFIRRRVPDPSDAEDILQEVFFELVEANRLLMPIDHITGWLYRVARNRIVDLFRKRQPELAGATRRNADDDLLLDEVLPSPDEGPEAVYERRILLEALWRALGELPAEQRAVFVAHEIEGRSFKEMSAESGVSVNTLLSRKRYAVLRLRERLRNVYDDLTKA